MSKKLCENCKYYITTADERALCTQRVIHSNESLAIPIQVAREPWGFCKEHGKYYKESCSHIIIGLYKRVKSVISWLKRY